MVKVEQIENQVATLTEGADMLAVSTRQEYEALCRQEDTAVAIKKQVEEYFGPDIKKAHELHRSLTSKRKALVDPLDKFIAVCKSVGGAYLMTEQRAKEEQQARLTAQAQEMGLDTSLVPQEAPKAEAGAGRAIVQTWTYEVVDEKLVPRKYWVLDHGKIRADVTNFKDKADIPGVKVVQQSSVRRTGK